MTDKRRAEILWWIREVADVLVPWYRGELYAAWGHRLPAEVVTRHRTDWENAIATMAETQVDYYSDRLRIDRRLDRGRMLDVGCGPMFPARHIANTELWCVDPLLDDYSTSGFPVRDANAILLPTGAENLWTVPSDFFDTVVSVNAMDHVDNFAETVAEIERVAKPNAFIRLELTYHSPTPTEPLVLHDILVQQAFRIFPVRNIAQRIDNQGLVYTIWSNDDGVT